MYAVSLCANISGFGTLPGGKLCFNERNYSILDCAF